MLSPAATRVLAILVLAGMGLSLVFCLTAYLRRLPFTPLQSSLYALNVLIARVLWGAQVRGRLPVLPGQGAVIVSNHRSSIDPCFIALATHRVVHWMIAKEYWRNPLLAWLFRTSEAIPVGRRGIDTAATRAAIRLARGGALVGLFPEGRINTTDRVLLPGRAGAALIALEAGVPVIPCYVRGSPYDGTYWGCLLTPARVRLTIGPAIDVSEFYGRQREREVLEMLTKRFLTEIAHLSGVPDYQPELAGRFGKPGLAQG